MPIHERANLKNPYFQYGTTGHKYYYIKGNERSRKIAYNKALKQQKAVHVRR